MGNRDLCYRTLLAVGVAQPGVGDQSTSSIGLAISKPAIRRLAFLAPGVSCKGAPAECSVGVLTSSRIVWQALVNPASHKGSPARHRVGPARYRL